MGLNSDDMSCLFLENGKIWYYQFAFVQICMKKSQGLRFSGIWGKVQIKQPLTDQNSFTFFTKRSILRYLKILPAQLITDTTFSPDFKSVTVRMIIQTQPKQLDFYRNYLMINDMMLTSGGITISSVSAILLFQTSLQLITSLCQI